MTKKNWQRFMRFVVALPSPPGIEGPCWVWTGSQKKRGYGRFMLEGKNVLAHRAAYKHMIGDPGDKLLDHQCNHKDCVNPNHLKPVTLHESNDDVNQKRRSQR